MRLCHDNCTSWNAYAYGDSTDYPDYEADPDIAGVGVVTAFVASSYITLLFGLLNLILTASQDENSIDSWFFKVLGHPKLFKVTRENREFWLSVIEKVVLNLSDQQILAGLSILITEFATHCSISAYHFALAANLAWMSSSVHLMTLSILRNYLRARPILRGWRVFLMLCIMVFLIASTFMQSHWAFYESWSFNVQCLFYDSGAYFDAVFAPGSWIPANEPYFWMKVDIALIAYNYPLNILALYNSPFEEWMYNKPMQFLDRKIRSFGDRLHQTRQHSTRAAIAQYYYSRMKALLTVLRKSYFWLGAFINSRCTDWVFNLAWAVYGLYNILSNRSIAASQMNGNENTMTFGQIIPLLLLSSTIFVFREAYEDQKLESKKLSKASISQVSLVQNKTPSTLSSAAASPIDPALEKSGALEESEDETKPPGISPRRVDTEMGGKSQASGLESSLQSPKHQRRPTYERTLHRPAVQDGTSS